MLVSTKQVEIFFVCFKTQNILNILKAMYNFGRWQGENNLSDYFTPLLIKLRKENIRVVHSSYMQKKNYLQKKKKNYPSDILAFLSHTHTHKKKRKQGAPRISCTLALKYKMENVRWLGSRGSLRNIDLCIQVQLCATWSEPSHIKSSTTKHTQSLHDWHMNQEEELRAVSWKTWLRCKAKGWHKRIKPQP